MTSIKNEQLRVKSYFASSVQAAMESASRELGPDALLLNSRLSPPEARHLGRLEVVFGAARKATDSESAVGDQSMGQSGAVEGLDELKRQMKELRDLIKGLSPAATERGGQAFIERTLVLAGVEERLAAEIERAVNVRLGRRDVSDISRQRRTQDWDSSTVQYELVKELGDRISVDPKLQRVTALVGPPGCGKTTAIVKLAATQGLACGRAVRFISIDTQRIGGADQLRTYAGIMGAAFQCVESAVELAKAVDSAPSGDMLFIDTPGLGPALLSELGLDLADWITGRQDIDTHLVLTACARVQELRSAGERFALFRPSHLLFTKLDETESVGALYSEAVRQGKPLSYICSGQSIPEDIEVASRETLAGSLARELPQLVSAAA